MLLDEKTLDKYEALPFRRVKSKRSLLWYYDEDRTHSFNTHWCSGHKYAYNLLTKNVGKSASIVLHKLKNHPQYKKNYAFRKGINDQIEELLFNIDKYAYGSETFYVENDTIKIYKRVSTWLQLKPERERKDFYNDVYHFKINDGSGLSSYAIRVYGVWYFLSKENHELILVKARGLEINQLSSDMIYGKDYNLIPLDKYYLKHYDLKNSYG